MSIHLVGGGRADDYDGEVYLGFVHEAVVRAAASGRTIPIIGVLLVGGGDEAAEYADAYRSQLVRTAECAPVITQIADGELFTSAVLDDIDGLLIGGGVTPSYFDAVTPIMEQLRLLVADGLPYLGFSAGAAIAADTAIIGGWRIDGIPICDEDFSEELDDVTVVEGLGLVDLAVEVHAAQWGTLTRLIAATEAGLVEGGIAIDEFTALIVGEDGFRVVGRGSIWQVVPHDDGVLVSSLGA
ncbi:MAG: Type 1 glutamine amidotransferase-like domain-containing protein [Microbacteriaceae bacterium]